MDVIVIGAGIAGLAVAYELGQAGHTVKVISQDEPGAIQSAGASRIFRLHHEEIEQVVQAQQSVAGWERWEQTFGCELLDRSGVVMTGVGPHELRGLSIELTYGNGIVHPLSSYTGDWIMETTGATIHAAVTIEQLQQRVHIKQASVTSVTAASVTLSTGEQLEADKIVVCAGVHTHELLGLPIPQQATLSRVSFRVLEPGVPLPVWMQEDPTVSLPFYALPDGDEHYAIGFLGEEPPFAEAIALLVDIIKQYFPGLDDEPVRTIECHTIIIDVDSDATAPNDGWEIMERNGIVGVAGSNLFKFAPYIGETISGRLTI